MTTEPCSAPTERDLEIPGYRDDLALRLMLANLGVDSIPTRSGVPGTTLFSDDADVLTF
jgi:hypothetical protein